MMGAVSRSVVAFLVFQVFAAVFAGAEIQRLVAEGFGFRYMHPAQMAFDHAFTVDGAGRATRIASPGGMIGGDPFDHPPDHVNQRGQYHQLAQPHSCLPINHSPARCPGELLPDSGPNPRAFGHVLELVSRFHTLECRRTRDQALKAATLDTRRGPDTVRKRTPVRWRGNFKQALSRLLCNPAGYRVQSAQPR